MIGPAGCLASKTNRYARAVNMRTTLRYFAGFEKMASKLNWIFLLDGSVGGCKNPSLPPDPFVLKGCKSGQVDELSGAFQGVNAIGLAGHFDAKTIADDSCVFS